MIPLGSSVALSRPAERVVAFYNQRGTAEQHTNEGKNAIKWTRLSCRSFRNEAVRLQLHALAYNLGNFMRTLALPDAVEQWSLTTLREKLIKIGANIVRHGHYVTFQMAEVAIPRDLFADIPRRIDRLRPPPSAPDDIKAQACDVWRRAHRALGYPVVRSPTRPNSRTRGDKAEPRRVGPHASSELGFARCVEKPPADDAEL